MTVKENKEEQSQGKKVWMQIENMYSMLCWGGVVYFIKDIEILAPSNPNVTFLEIGPWQMIKLAYVIKGGSLSNMTIFL